MKVITLAGQKGGCGKSSLAISLATLAARQHKRVAILDTDPQRTVLYWKGEREAPTPEVLEFKEALETQLKVLTLQGVELLFIDTPGQDQYIVATAMRGADFTLIPCRPTAADVHATATTARAALKLAPAAACVLTQVSPRGTRADEAAAALAEFGEVAPVRIAQRMTWQDSYNLNMGVSEYEPNGPAARELAALWRWMNVRIKGLEHATKNKDQAAG